MKLSRSYSFVFQRRSRYNKISIFFSLSISSWKLRLPWVGYIFFWIGIRDDKKSNLQSYTYTIREISLLQINFLSCKLRNLTGKRHDRNGAILIESKYLRNRFFILKSVYLIKISYYIKQVKSALNQDNIYLTNFRIIYVL